METRPRRRKERWAAGAWALAAHRRPSPVVIWANRPTACYVSEIMRRGPYILAIVACLAVVPGCKRPTLGDDTYKARVRPIEPIPALHQASEPERMSHLVPMTSVS